jgi:hypothetical protein
MKRFFHSRLTPNCITFFTAVDVDWQTLEKSWPSIS